MKEQRLLLVHQFVEKSRTLASINFEREAFVPNVYARQ
jgi:hypothetical protein